MKSLSSRGSKVRHVYAEHHKAELHYVGLNYQTTMGDHNYLAMSSKFFAIPSRGGGGPIVVIPTTRVGKQPDIVPTICGHTGNVLGIEFNPFNDCQLASGSDDATVKIWTIPEGGLIDKLTVPTYDLIGHGKTVTFVSWNPCAENILATTSKDSTVKVWNVAKQECIHTYDTGKLVHDMKWTDDGKYLGLAFKDRTFQLYDVRKGEKVQECCPHESPKVFKFAFITNKNMIVTVGFTMEAQRQIKVWKFNDMSAPISELAVDDSSGIIFPFYEPGNNMLFLSGRGDGNIRFYEIVDDAPYIFYLNEVKTTDSCVGAVIAERKYINPLKFEILRMFRLVSGNKIIPTSFIVPRKDTSFQPDLYPDCPAGIPSMTAEEWISGENKPPILTSMDPTKTGTLRVQEPVTHADFIQTVKEPVKQPEPVKEPETIKVPEPVKQPEPVKLPEPVKQPERVKEQEHVKPPEPVKQPEPVKIPEAFKKQPEKLSHDELSKQILADFESAKKQLREALATVEKLENGFLNSCKL